MAEINDKEMETVSGGIKMAEPGAQLDFEAVGEFDVCDEIKVAEGTERFCRNCFYSRAGAGKEFYCTQRRIR